MPCFTLNARFDPCQTFFQHSSVSDSISRVLQNSELRLHYNFSYLHPVLSGSLHSQSSHFLRSILITSCRSLSRRHYLPGSLYNTLSPYEGSLSRLDPPVLNRELNQARNNCPSSDILYYNLTYCSCYQSNLIRDSFKSHLSGVTKDCQDGSFHSKLSLIRSCDCSRVGY